MLKSTRSVSLFPPEAFPSTPPFSYPFSFIPVPGHPGFGYFRDLLWLSAVLRSVDHVPWTKWEAFFFQARYYIFLHLFKYHSKIRGLQSYWAEAIDFSGLACVYFMVDMQEFSPSEPLCEKYSESVIDRSYNLHLECPPKAYVLSDLISSWELLGSGRTLKKWGLRRGSYVIMGLPLRKA